MKSPVARTLAEESWSSLPRRSWRAMAKLGWHVALPAVVLAACAKPEVLALEHEVHVVEGGVETLVSSGCDELPNAPGAGFGFGFGTGPAPGGSGPSYSVSYEFQNDLVRVSADVAGGPSTEVEYDEFFLRSGAEDEIALDLGGGSTLRLLNRGVDSCDFSSVTSGPSFASE